MRRGPIDEQHALEHDRRAQPREVVPVARLLDGGARERRAHHGAVYSRSIAPFLALNKLCARAGVSGQLALMETYGKDKPRGEGECRRWLRTGVGFVE